MFYLIGRNREILRWVFIISMLFVRLSVAFRSGYVRNRYRSLHSLSISDTSNSGFHTAISFYKFVTIDDDRVDRIVSEAKQKLSQLPVKGTLLVAKEGYNGQFVVPKQLLQDSFLKTLESVDPLFSDLEINIGETIDYNQQQIPFPFKRLLVKRKKEIITAGLGEDLNWEDSGREVDPEEWHTALAADSAPIVLDCRNNYESEIGSFAGAKPLDTNTFRDSWEKLDELLDGVDKDTPILTYCTGGIRCVKINAYLKQRKGFTNTGRLKKGIIGYEQWLRDQNEQESKFEGVNFLFDRRRLVDGEESDN